MVNPGKRRPFSISQSRADSQVKGKFEYSKKQNAEEGYGEANSESKLNVNARLRRDSERRPPHNGCQKPMAHKEAVEGTGLIMNT